MTSPGLAGDARAAIGEAEIDTILGQTAAAQQNWAAVPLERRAELVNQLAGQLRRQREHLARLATEEMGKPIAQAESEIDKCAQACQFFAENGAEFLASMPVRAPFDRAYVQFDPLGVILGIMPWNFPFWQVLRLAAPALIAGNAVLLKHASNVPQCALAIEELIRQAGFPEDIFRTLLIPASATEPIIADHRVSAVCVTASSEAGATIASIAGRHLKKQVLELGGSDAFIVLNDANVATAAREAVRARMLNAGQSCVAAKRFIVQDNIAEEFARLLTDGVRGLVMGDPWDRRTDVGPLAREDLAEALAVQVDASIAAGARPLVGGGPREGAYYPPTVLADVTPDMPVFAEETFGPVAALVSARDDSEAVDLANLSEYGLAASIWTADPDRAARMAGGIRVGSVFINCRVSSDPSLPFGGVKRSGYGRELGSFGIRELTLIKAVAARHVTGD